MWSGGGAGVLSLSSGIKGQWVAPGVCQGLVGILWLGLLGRGN